ncbi:hypothetical protein DMC47_15605, partial [Nostoc sp. 3335mG]
MRKTLLGLTALAVAIPSVTVATPASAQNYGRYERDYRDGRYDRHYDRRGYYNGPSWRGRDGRQYCRRSDGTTGLLVGAVGGALVGRTIDTRGDRTVGTVLGGVLGALAGREIE